MINYFIILILNIYLPNPLHEYQHHEITALSQHQHDHTQMTNAKEFAASVAITII